jgi:elongation factor 3
MRNISVRRVHPEAKYYYELEGSTLNFNFPVPGRLDGVNSNTRAILKMENVSFTYPGSANPTLRNVNVKVCLGSRIAVVGANGAGKTTLIRMLVQESKPDEGSGTIYKHMNLRVAYVAQHSFHHVEQHLDASPVDYFKWRFYGGVDREDMARPDKKMTEEEEVERTGDRKYGDVDEVLGRRKFGRTMEYECSFIGQVHGREPNKYISLEKMNEMGLQKLVQQCDTRTAAMAAGLDVRPLLTAEIQGHLNDFNLDAEFGTHSTIKRLSGGQKVKLVLAAAMWNKPHVIVLDEPTNYLDREALGALTQAIKNFAGGVVIISHNKEFTDAICTEQWLVKDGQCFTHGGVEEAEKVRVSKVKKSSSAGNLEDTSKGEEAGNLNKTISSDIILNPKTLEALSKKQVRLLERCAQVAGVTVKDYVLKINCKSPEWKWL